MFRESATGRIGSSATLCTDRVASIGTMNNTERSTSGGTDVGRVISTGNLSLERVVSGGYTDRVLSGENARNRGELSTMVDDSAQHIIGGVTARIDYRKLTVLTICIVATSVVVYLFVTNKGKEYR
jgi:hypothetical protein